MTSTFPVLGYFGHQNLGDDAFEFCWQHFGKNHGLSFKCERQFVGQKYSQVLMGGGNLLGEYFFSKLPKYDKLHVVCCASPWGNICDDFVNVADKIETFSVRNRKDYDIYSQIIEKTEFVPDMVLGWKPEISQFSTAISDYFKFATLPPLKRSNFGEKKLCFVILSSDYFDLDLLKFLGVERNKILLANVLDELSEWYDIVMPSFSVWYNARTLYFLMKLSDI